MTAPLNGATLIAALPGVSASGAVGGYVVVVEHGDEFVIASVRKLTDEEWTGGRWLRFTVETRHDMLARALRVAARRASERTFDMGGSIYYDCDMRDN